jgi:hypothetical protein
VRGLGTLKERATLTAVTHAASRYPETLKITPATDPSPSAGGEGLEFVHFGLTPKYQLTIALARLRERGGTA